MLKEVSDASRRRLFKERFTRSSMKSEAIRDAQSRIDGIAMNQSREGCLFRQIWVGKASL